MAEVATFVVKEVLGVQKSDDGTHMLVGFQTTADEEIALALGADQVVDVLNDFFEATTIVHFKKGAFSEAQGQAAFDVDWFEIGKIQETDDLTLTLMRGEAHMTFRLPSGMAPKIHETLGVLLGIANATAATPAGNPS